MNPKSLSSFIRKSKESSVNTETKSARMQSGKADRIDQWLRLLPFALLACFVLIVALLFGERLLPANPVKVSSVVVQRSETATTENAKPTPASDPTEHAFEAEVLFQASGWLEADPYPERAVALVDGVVAQVDVLEGEAVKAGQRIARLIDEDQRLLRNEAQARFEQSTQQVELHVRERLLREAELQRVHAEIRVAEARLAELADTAERMKTLSDGAVPEQEVAQALLRLKTQQAQVEALATRVAELEQMIEQAQLRIEIARAAKFEAEARLELRKLALKRTEIRAPIDGIIQRLNAYPGRKVMAGADNMESLTLAVIFDPDSLQARIDVPLEEAAKLQVGQWARVRSNLLPNQFFRGRVTRIVGESDLQRNTLQAKVELLETDPRMRPEMLCRVEFLESATTPQKPGRAGDASSSVALFVPKTALLQVSGDRAQLFRLAADRSRVQRIEASIATDSNRPDFVRIVSGLNPGDQVVIAPDPDLKDQSRIRIQP